MERMIARTRDALRRMKLVGRRVKSSHGWMIGLVVCVLLVRGISLAALGREGAAKKESPPTATASNAPAKAEAAPANPATKHEASSAPAPREKNAEKGGGAEKNAEREKEPAPTAPQDLFATPAAKPKVDDVERIRARAEWFCSQRAYPFDRIPPGARQRALQQMDDLIQQQKVREQLSGKPATAGLAAPQPPIGQAAAIIDFPGLSTWTLIGP